MAVVAPGGPANTYEDVTGDGPAEMDMLASAGVNLSEQEALLTRNARTRTIREVLPNTQARDLSCLCGSLNHNQLSRVVSIQNQAFACCQNYLPDYTMFACCEYFISCTHGILSVASHRKSTC